MIKKIKTISLKNKTKNNNDFISEEEIQSNLNDKKSLLKSEILKQIDIDIRREMLKEEMKVEKEK